MNKKLGFIGGGNMGGAMIGGIIGSGVLKAEDIYVSDLYQPSLDKVNSKYGVNVTTDSLVLAKNCDIIILSVKPNLYEPVINQIKDHVKDDVVIVTIAPGKTLEYVKGLFGKEIKIVRTMPNTPAMVEEGMTAYCPNNLTTPEDVANVVAVLSSFGKAEKVGEYLMDVVVGVSGSSPAYIYMFIEALADGAVAMGMPRTQAYTFAAQAVYGSAKMVLETGMHPGALKDMVCSPGGTTICAVESLEATGFRSSVIKAVRTATEKSAIM